MLAIRTGVAVAITLLLLTGCTPETPPAADPTTTPVPKADATTEPTEPLVTGMPALDGQQVATITANATAPNGAVLGLTMTVFYPVAADSPEGQQIAAYLASVGDTSSVGNPEFVADAKALLQLSDISAVAVSGTWPNTAGVLPNLGPGKADTIVGVPAGPVVGTRLSITGAGFGYGVAALFNQDATAADPAAWADRFTYYGFTDGFAGASVSDCNISITDLGTASSGVSNWSQHNCFVGVGD